MRVFARTWNGVLRLPESFTTVPDPLGRRLRAFLGGLVILYWEATMWAYDCLIAYLAGTFRALHECHMNHAPICKMV